MKMLKHVFVLFHTRACGREVGFFTTLRDASNTRENSCSSDTGRIYGCRLIRFDRQARP